MKSKIERNCRKIFIVPFRSSKLAVIWVEVPHHNHSDGWNNRSCLCTVQVVCVPYIQSRERFLKIVERILTNFKKYKNQKNDVKVEKNNAATLIKAGCDMNIKKSTYNSHFVSDANISWLFFLRRWEFIVEKRNPTRQKWLWYECQKATRHNQFDDWITF